MALLIYLMRMVKALLDNSSLFLEKYVSIKSSLLTQSKVYVACEIFGGYDGIKNVCYLTNEGYIFPCVRVYCNRSHMTSQRVKNIKFT